MRTTCQFEDAATYKRHFPLFYVMIHIRDIFFKDIGCLVFRTWLLGSTELSFIARTSRERSNRFLTAALRSPTPRVISTALERRSPTRCRGKKSRTTAS